jgi:hypothetical protein
MMSEATGIPYSSNPSQQRMYFASLTHSAVNRQLRLIERDGRVLVYKDRVFFK